MEETGQVHRSHRCGLGSPSAWHPTLFWGLSSASGCPSTVSIPTCDLVVTEGPAFRRLRAFFRTLFLGILTTSEQGTLGFQPALDPADPVTLLPGALIFFYQRRKEGLDWAQGP